MVEERRRIPVQTLAGPGVPGVEYDPPLFHYDLTREEMLELLANPAKFVDERLDWDDAQRALRPGSNRRGVTVSDLIWTNTEWVSDPKVLPPDGGTSDGGLPTVAQGPPTAAMT
jgi:hypothetical protein